MSTKQRGLLIISGLVIASMLISSCQMSASSAPAATPTLLPTGQFVSPLPSAENPMDLIAEFAKQTSVAQTTVANGGTPLAPQNVVTTGTVLTPANGSETPTLAASTPTNAAITTPVVSTPSGPTATLLPAGVRPASYTLQKGEFPYCIARRFNVDPDELLALSGLTSAQADSLVSGTVLKIPQSGAFPGDRALAAHPATYTVPSSDETIYGVACKFGDVDPAAIASANGIPLSASLSAGQQIKIP